VIFFFFGQHNILWHCSSSQNCLEIRIVGQIRKKAKHNQKASTFLFSICYLSPWIGGPFSLWAQGKKPRPALC